MQTWLAAILVLCAAAAPCSAFSPRRELKFYSLQRFLGREPKVKIYDESLLMKTTEEVFSKMEEVPDCSCALDGVSGGVSTPFLGCLDHLKDDGMPNYFCMIVDGPGCENSNPSTAFPGATWRGCDGVSGGKDEDHLCVCSQDGNVDGIETGRMGCGMHEDGVEPFCMVDGGCESAKTSQDYPGTAWRDCGIP